MASVTTLEEDIRRFLAPGSGDGSGYGDGYGDGSGYGDGYGSGYGYGYGDGDGSGSGDGSGHGNGSGSGSGSGYGDGSGDGYGDGYGDGSGDGDGSGSGSGYGDGYGYGYGDGDGDGSGDWKSINGRRIYYIDALPTVIEAVHGDYAQGFIVGRDLVLRPCYIARKGDNWAHGDTLHDAVRDAKEKWMEDRPLEDRLEAFVAAHPDLDTPYGDLFQWHHILTGSCEAGRKQWCREHGYVPTDSITVRSFIEQTRFDYGHEAIDKLSKLYNS